jgi:hypothetical protein
MLGQMRRDRVLRRALAALALPLLAIPATAQSMVTIGSSLQRAANASRGGCVGGTCTLAIGALDADRQASDGISSPVNGTITTWRIRTGITPGPAALRVVRPLAGGLYTSGGATAQTTPTADAISTFAAQLPIQQGDLIGVDCCGAGGATFFTMSSPQTTRLDFEPGPLAAGPGTAAAGSDNFEVLVNADIEPTSAFTVTKVRRKKGGAISVTVQLPNPGTLVAGDPHDYALGAPGVKPLLLKPGVEDVGLGSVTVTARTTQRARDVLARRGRLKVRVKILFTPKGGLPSGQIRKVKLKG